MNGFKQNRFLIVYLVIVVLGAGGLGYLLYQTKSELDLVSQDYDATAKKLHDLKNRKPFPDDKNLKQLKELQAQYATEIKTLADELNKQTPPLKEVSPQGFQDQLREVVSTVTKKAAEQGVTLPANFYMGFDRYKDSPPSAVAAPVLSRQLASITLVVNKLLQFKVHQIDRVSRKELPEEATTAPAPQKRIISQYPFEIVFVADQDNLRHAFNSILTAEQFYIIRGFEVLNSQPSGPSRKEKEDPSKGSAGRGSRQRKAAETASAAASPAPAGQEAAPESGLRVIVGQETLTVALKIEQVCFDVPEIK